MSEYKFDVTITDKRFYNEGTSWGVFGFSTKTEEDIPHLVKDDFDDFGGFGLSDKEQVRHGVIAGSVQNLEVGTEYELTAIVEYSKKFKTYNFVPKTARPKIPTTIGRI